MAKDELKVANKKFISRLIVGTGKYKNFEETALAVKSSGAEIVTVAVRRVNILDKGQPLLMDYLDPKTIVSFFSNLVTSITFALAIKSFISTILPSVLDCSSLAA